ncbi:hypothetical protein G9F32_16415 [Acinetobacter sp. 194]|uniref:hypothetical protein n=1 Tax=Acinetobacter shaoyimingii TaxID=2715164 RepID=UPI0014075260|nr:hypothetical protein [Acinetobacter shaoyimingii]NHB59579.1 hypothetical protein [Acinetobacter shaoyimingii]
MNIKTELNEILKTSSLFSNIGNNISNEIIYPIKYLKDINDIPKIIDGTKYVNSEVEIINNLRSQLFDKYGQIGLKELNLFIKDVKLALKDFSNIFEKYYNGDQFENVMILINSYLINYFIEYFVNEKCETEFHFF